MVQWRDQSVTQNG